MHYIFESYKGLRKAVTSFPSHPHCKNSFKLWNYESNYICIIIENTDITKTRIIIQGNNT